MATALLPDSGDFDFLLQEVCAALQLPSSRHERAKKSYEAVIDWLEAPGSPLENAVRRCFPQGSMALGTTNKPVGKAEYDLDFVAVFNAPGIGPAGLYELVHDRLSAHATYKPLLERRNRCVSLTYTGDFHLDLVPAIPDVRRGGTTLQIPDMRRGDWTSSDPEGYAAWFRARGQVGLTEALRKAAAVAPVPDIIPVREKSALTLAVQLLKRRRDLVFSGPRADLAPRSIVLTTLAGAHYKGSDSVSGSMVGILDGMSNAFAAAHPHQLVIYNPTNRAEHFCDAMTSSLYQELVNFTNQLRRDVFELFSLSGPALRRRLEELFGGEVVTEAFRKWTERAMDKRIGGSLAASTGGLSIISEKRAVPVKTNTFFGD